ncbi:MAG: hypothetical protein KF819_39615 [Labilithrix sp.]|nr:hypothetical protein [Labilithrix sp.]
MSKTTFRIPCILLCGGVLAACRGSAPAPAAPVIAHARTGATVAAAVKVTPPAPPTALDADAGAADDPCAEASPAMKNSDASYRAMISPYFEQYFERVVFGSDWDIEGRDNLDFMEGPIASARSTLVQLKCLDPAAGAALEPRVMKWIADTEAAVDAQEKCRVDVTCGSARLKKLYCATVADHRRQKAHEEAAARARKRDGSVPECVRHGECHDLVGQLEGQMGSLQAQHEQLTGKKLTERACKP